MNVSPKSENERIILSYLEENKETLFKTLSSLVKIDTQNFRTHGKENDGQELLEKLCLELGLAVDRFAPDTVEGLTSSPDYMKGRGTDLRENLVATYCVPNATKSVMFAAHMDTVQIGDITAWTDDPFSGAIRDGKIYGRGSGDDKFGLAAGYYLIKAFKETAVSPKKNLLIGSYVDEEGGGGGGALGLALKYPVDALFNLDASGFETEALGGGCFDITVRSTQNDKAIASIMDVFTGLNLIKEELEAIHGKGKNTIRLSTVTAGTGGTKEGALSFAIYTDMTKEETVARLAEICERLKPRFDDLSLSTDGFVLRTRFFIYGETDRESREVQVLSSLLEEQNGIVPDTKGTCLSDLSLLLRYGTKNSFNFGIPRGSKEGGGAHQPNEHIDCETLLTFTKILALLILRT